MNALSQPLLFFFLSFVPGLSSHMMSMASIQLPRFTPYDAWIMKLRDEYQVGDGPVLVLTQKPVRVTEISNAKVYWPTYQAALMPTAKDLYAMVIVDTDRPREKNLRTWFLTYCFTICRYGGKVIISTDRNVIMTMEKE